jgi:excinuclease ABC subunit C
MKQVLERRCKYYLEHPNQIPQLVIIDGGKGQVNVARDVLKDFIHQGLIVLGVSKGPSRKAGMEKLLIANENIEQTLAKDNEALHLLQHIRDESHRFAITFHRNRRQKKSLESSLEKIPGVGGGRRKLLLQRFGGLRELRGASIEEIAKVSSIGYDLAKRIFEHLREN